MTLAVRNLQEDDIAFLDHYWQSLSPADCERMAIDRSKLPKSEDFRNRLLQLLQTPVSQRPADPLIWTINGTPVGFTNLNSFNRPHQAEVHLHMIKQDFRGKGYGRKLFVLSLIEYFRRHDLHRILCQPASSNPFPNKMMAVLGVKPTKTYTTIPSVICYEHEVNCYDFDKLLVKSIATQQTLDF